MTDIVERLRRFHPDTLTDDELMALGHEAAAEIEGLRASYDAAWAANERLNAENATLRAAQDAIRAWCADAQAGDPDAGYISAAEYAVALLDAKP